MDEKQIDKYLRGELSAKEIRAFEIELESNPELAEAFRLQHLAHTAIRLEGQNQLKSSLLSKGEKLWQEPQQKPTVRSLWLILPILAAASLSLFILFGPGPEPWDSEKLFAQYYALPDGPAQRGDILPGDSAWVEAMNAWNLGDFEKAELLMEIQLKTDFKRKGQCLYYLGLAELELDKPLEAAAHFSQPLLSYNQVFEDSRWYLGLALLKGGDLEQAKATFARVGDDPNSKFQQMAGEILDKIKSNP